MACTASAEMACTAPATEPGSFGKSASEPGSFRKSATTFDASLTEGSTRQSGRKVVQNNFPTKQRQSCRDNLPKQTRLSAFGPSLERMSSHLRAEAGAELRRASVFRPSGALEQLRNLHSTAAPRTLDIEHMNTKRRSLENTHRIVYGSPLLVLFFFLFIYVTCTLVFGSLFYAFGEGCFALDDDEEHSFEMMLWISVHAFSSIGFGNLVPRGSCSGAQIMILLESFASLLVVSAISGYVVKKFMRPLSAVRFSSSVLVNSGRRRVEEDEEESKSKADARREPRGAYAARGDDASSGGEGDESDNGSVSHDGRRSRRLSHTAEQAMQHYRFLTFRMVRQGLVQLRDVRVQMQAQYWVAGATAFGDRDSHKGRVVSLALEQDYFTTLELLTVWHRIDEASPLWRMRDTLMDHLDGLEVSVSAFDMASLQHVMFFKRYERDDLVHGSVFDNTLTLTTKKNRQIYLADHSKLDNHSPEDNDSFSKRPKKRGAFRRLSIGASKNISQVAAQAATQAEQMMSGTASAAKRFSTGDARFLNRLTSPSVIKGASSSSPVAVHRPSARRSSPASSASATTPGASVTTPGESVTTPGKSIDLRA